MSDKPTINFLHYKPENRAEEEKQPKRKRLIFLLFACFSIFLLFFIVRDFRLEKPVNDPNVYDPVTLEPIKPKGFLNKIRNLVFDKNFELKGQSNNRINFLLLGIGGPGHDGPYLSDTMMIASVEPATGKIAMVSIPRDLWVKIPGYGWHKINHANSFGEEKNKNMGPAFASQVVEETFDLPIHYYVRLDFEAFKEIIDEVGGIKINVEKSFVDQMYPAPNYEYQTISFKTGVQTMNGIQALQYARSRHGNNGEGSDFARAKRQQKMLLALKEKILSFNTLANPIKINNILQSLNQHIVTNLEFADIISLIKIGKELNTSNITTLVLDNNPQGFLTDAYSQDGAYILQPTSGAFTEINKAIENIFSQILSEYNDTPAQETPTLKEANIEIQNGTWNAGLAARMKKRLEDKGYKIIKIGNTQNRPLATGGIFNLTSKNIYETLQSLQDELQTPIKQNVPQNEIFDPNADILIILGDNVE